MRDNFVFPLDDDEELVDNISFACGNKSNCETYLYKVYGDYNFKHVLFDEGYDNPAIVRNLLEMPLIKLKDKKEIYDFKLHIIGIGLYEIEAHITINPWRGKSISFRICIEKCPDTY